MFLCPKSYVKTLFTRLDFVMTATCLKYDYFGLTILNGGTTNHVLSAPNIHWFVPVFKEFIGLLTLGSFSIGIITPPPKSGAYSITRKVSQFESIDDWNHFISHV